MAASAMAASGVAEVQFDAPLIRALTRQGPRYISYPTADRFTEAFRVGDYLQAVNGVRALAVGATCSRNEKTLDGYYERIVAFDKNLQKLPSAAGERMRFSRTI